MMEGTSKKLYESSLPIDCIAINSESKDLAFVGSSLSGDMWNGNVGVLHFDEEKDDDKMMTQKTFVYLPCGTSAVRWIKDDIIVLGSDDGIVSLTKLNPDGSSDVLCEDSVHDDMVVSVDYNSTLKLIASGSYDNTVKIWGEYDAERHTMPLKACFTQNTECHGVSWINPNCLAAICSDGKLYLYDTSSNHCSALVKCSNLSLTAVSSICDGDNSYVVVGDDTGMVQVWDVRKMSDDKPLFSANPHSWACTSLVMSKDAEGKLLIASGGEDRRVIVRTLEGEKLYEDRTHKDAVNSLEWAKGMAHLKLLSASRDKTILAHNW